MDTYSTFLKLPDKKSIIYLIVAAVFASAIFVVVMYYIYLMPTGTQTSQSQEEALIQKQLKELDRLRQEANVQPLTEKEIAQQANELDASREKAKAKPLSEEAIQNQTAELDKLRAAAR